MRLATMVAPRRSARARFNRVLLMGATTEGVYPRVSTVDASGRRGAALRGLVHRVLAMPTRPQVVGAAAIAASTGVALAGPMAGLVLAGYAVVGVVLWRRARTRRADARCRRRAADAVAALAADLRAGLSMSAALAQAAPQLQGPAVSGQGAAGVARRVAESIGVAESSGAPLADVLDRLDSHLRAVDRASAAASAQAAGARASAVMLAIMPVGAVAVGTLIGGDPLGILLHTPIGAACLGGATLLQTVGLMWATKLSDVEVPV